MTSQSYSVRNALVRRNKEIIDETKRNEYPYRVANREVFALEKKGAMAEIPRGTPSLETFQENSLLGLQALSVLEELESYLNYSTIYNPEYFEGQIRTSVFASARSVLIEYINNLKFKVIPDINRTRDRNLISQTLSTLNKIYTKLKQTVQFVFKEAYDEAEKKWEDLDNFNYADDEEEKKDYGRYGTLMEVLGNEKSTFDDLLNQITQIRGMVQGQLTSGVEPVGKFVKEEQPELQQQEIKENIPEVNEPFQEDQNLDELGNEEHLQFDAGEDVGAGYDPIGQQKSQFEAGEKRYRDEMKQDEDDLEGMGLRFRLAKTKNKKR
jgi:hypothetical protein